MIRQPFIVDITKCFAIVKSKGTHRQCKNRIDTDIFCCKHDKLGTRKCGYILSIYSTETEIEWIGRFQEMVYKIENTEESTKSWYFLCIQLYYILRYTKPIWDDSIDFKTLIEPMIPSLLKTNQDNPDFYQLDLDLFSCLNEPFCTINLGNPELIWCGECTKYKPLSDFKPAINLEGSNFVNQCNECYISTRKECNNCFSWLKHHQFTNTPCCNQTLCKECWIKHEEFGSKFEIEDVNPITEEVVIQELRKDVTCMFCRHKLPKYVDYLLELLSTQNNINNEVLQRT